MSVWIAKISALLVAATLIGIAVDRWWVRRRRTKVKFDYARLLQEGIKPRESVASPVRSSESPESSAVALPPRPTPWRRHSLLDALPAPLVGIGEPSPQDLARIHRRLDELAEAVSTLHLLSTPPPAPPSVDLRPVIERLDALERTVHSFGAAADPGYTTPSTSAPRVVPVSVEVTRVRRGDDTDSTPTSGAPDDLKRIKGVKGAMERMLRDIGIDYFWQIAAWSPEEVRQAESRLGQFRGRIERDEWVAQAARLMRESDAAPRPDTLPQ